MICFSGKQYRETVPDGRSVCAFHAFLNATCTFFQIMTLKGYTKMKGSFSTYGNHTFIKLNKMRENKFKKRNNWSATVIVYTLCTSP